MVNEVLDNAVDRTGDRGAASLVGGAQQNLVVARDVEFDLLQLFAGAAPEVELDLLGIEAGVKVFNIERGKLYGISEDFIITHLNRTKITSASKLIDILENVEGLIYIEGIDKSGRRARYRFYGG